MKFEDVGLLRLAAQHIASADFERPEDVVRHMGAMQAQDYAGTKWSIALRTRNCNEADIERAVSERTILRTWPQRGTIHFVVPEEVRWRLILTTPRVLAGAKRRNAELGLTENDFSVARELFQTALQGDKQLSRPDMMQVLEDGGISTAGQRGYHILWHLSQNGQICFGPLQGKQPTFALLDEWVPKVPEISHDEALSRLVEKYFISHGPATLPDLVRWSGLTVADAKKGLGMASPVLESAVMAEDTYYFARNLTPAKAPNLFLLPGFDEYVLGYKDRSAVLHTDHANEIATGGNGMFQPTVVLNGQIVGTWKRSARKHGVESTMGVFADDLELPAALLAAAQGRYNQFLEA